MKILNCPVKESKEQLSESTMQHNLQEDGSSKGILKGIKIFEEIFLGILIIGIVFLIYAWTQSDNLPFAALLQILFVGSWVGLFGVIGSIALPTLFFIQRRKACRH